MAISKVIFNGDTLMDDTGNTAASNNMLSGVKAQGANGEDVTGAVVTAPASDTSPAMDGNASAGSASTYSRGDHVHPSDTSKQAKITASGILKGDGSGGVTAATSGTDYAAASHAHGNITSGGDITATAPTIASGDQIVINDNSASKITNGPTFDGSTTTKALTQKGTWETFLQSYTETDPTVPSWAKASSKPTYTASEVGALPDSTTIPSATSTSPKMDGTAAVGSESTFAKGDHVHPTDTSRQAKITVSGILKGDGSGGVSAATSGTDYAAASHAHGNITSGGDITATAPTIANGDQIIINDNSASKITNGPTFDGSTTTKALTPKGTWETFLQSYTETDPTVPSWAKQSTKPSYTASEVGALPDSTTIPTASTTNPSMDGTASYGSGTSYARSNHVHPTDTSRQAKITASGLLKGDGSGGVTAATAGTDYIASHQDISGKLDKSGGTMTGALTLFGDPTADLHAATKQYVDSNVLPADMSLHNWVRKTFSYNTFNTIASKVGFSYDYNTSSNYYYYMGPSSSSYTPYTTVSYSSSVSVNTSTGAITLTSPTSLQLTSTSNLSTLSGKYFKITTLGKSGYINSAFTTSEVYYFSAMATTTNNSRLCAKRDNLYVVRSYKVYDNTADVYLSSENRNAYPDNTVSYPYVYFYTGIKNTGMMKGINIEFSTLNYSESNIDQYTAYSIQFEGLPIFAALQLEYTIGSMSNNQKLTNPVIVLSDDYNCWFHYYNAEFISSETVIYARRVGNRIEFYPGISSLNNIKVMALTVPSIEE